MQNKQLVFFRNYQVTLFTLFFIMLVWDVVFPSNLFVLILGLFSIVPVLILKKGSIVSKEIRSYFSLTLFFIFIVIIHNYRYMYTQNILFSNNVSNLFLSIQLLWVLPLIFRSGTVAFKRALDITLFILALVFIIQFIGFYLTGDYLDVLKFFKGNGDDSKYMAYNSMLEQTGLNIIRPTSIFNEPGTYCSYSFILFSLSFLNHKKVKKIHLFVLVTYLMSLSAFGIAIAVASFIFIFYFELKKRITKKKGVGKLLIFSSPFILIFLNFVIKYYVLRFVNDSTGADGGLTLRFNSIQKYDQNSFEDKLYGLSFGYDQIESFFIQDTSMFFSITLYLGVFSIFIYLFFLLKFKFNLLILFFFILIGSTKIDFFSLAFWFFISIASTLYFDNMKNKTI